MNESIQKPEEKQRIADKISDMQVSFDKLHRLSREETEVSWEIRLKRLEQLEKLINDNREIIADVIYQDFGRRSKAETLLAEVFPCLEEVRHAKKHGKGWMKTQKMPTAKWFKPATSYVQSQPLGVVGIIAPWNYPLMLSLPPLIGALVAGNRAMIKLSEHAPIFASWLAKTIPEYFSDEEVCIITGETQVSQAFSSLPFDHLIFTGSTEVGKHVMRAASSNLTPVTLELGGKSPVIIDKNCDFNHTINRIWTGKLINAGQTCIAPDYVLIPESMLEKFIKKSKQWLKKHYPNIESNEDYSYLINHTQFKRVQGYLENANQINADVHALSSSEPNLDTKFMPPYIVTGLKEDSDLLTHEIFAPILPVVTYDNTSDGIDNAIKYVNNHPRPLALYVFSKDDDVCNKVMKETVSGGVCINDTVLHVVQSDLPFGGVGPSGMGNYHGKYGFDTFSHQKAIFKQSGINAMSLIQPPYGKIFEKTMKLLAR